MKVKCLKRISLTLSIVTGLSFFIPVAQASPMKPIVLEGQAAKVDLLETLPLDNTYFTQGFELSDQGDLYLGTGIEGASRVGQLDLTTGQFKNFELLDPQYFGEGITIQDQFLWQLTWQNHEVFKRDLKTLEVIETYELPSQGWGIAYDADRKLLWVSDGTDQIYQWTPDDFTLKGSIKVNYQGQNINQINELEYANGKLYANVWYSQQILVINPDNGQVEGFYDLSQILKDLPISAQDRQKMDVLNGIAHIQDDHFYLTGKFFPLIMKVRLQPIQ